MPAGVYIAATAALLIGIALGVIGHIENSGFEIRTFGAVFIGLGVGLGMFGGNVRSHLAYVIVIPLVIALWLAIYVWNIGGLGNLGL